VIARREGFLVRLEHVQNDGSVQIEEDLDQLYISRMPADAGTLVARVRNGLVESVEVYEQNYHIYDK
jgi:hypothetical protein